jgi:hypothetical protein
VIIGVSVGVSVGGFILLCSIVLCCVIVRKKIDTPLVPEIPGASFIRYKTVK